MMKFKKVFKTIVNFFEEENIDYALIGAFALKAYGYARFTRDLDFIARKKDKNRIKAFVESLGYETIYESAGFSKHVHPLSSPGRIDFVYVSGNTAETVFSEVRKMDVLADIKVQVVSPQHIAALKVFAIKNDPERLHSEMADLKALIDLGVVGEETVKSYFKKWNLLEVYNRVRSKK